MGVTHSTTQSASIINNDRTVSVDLANSFTLSVLDDLNSVIVFHEIV